MIRIAAPLSILAIASLAACSSYQEPASSRVATTSGSIAPQELPYRAGFGVVQNVRPAPAPVAAAAAGGTGPNIKSTSSQANTAPPQPSSVYGTQRVAPGTPMYRLTVKMDDGKIQWVDTDSTDIKQGMRIELTPDRFIKPA
jgi:hypothetical protein